MRGTARSPNERCRVRQKKQRGTRRYFPAKTRIFAPSRPTHPIYQLNSGHVQLQDGPEAIVDQLNPGDFFGEKCFLAPRRSGQVAMAVSPVEATAYRKSELLGYLQRDPRFAGRLLKSLASRLDRYENTIRDFVSEPAERRLAHLLFRFMPTRPASGWIRLPLRATNIELARMVGTTRWRVSHFLNQFQRFGWLRRRRQELLIYREGLEEFIGPAARDDVRSPMGHKGVHRSTSEFPGGVRAER